MLSVLLNAAYLVAKQQIPIIVAGLTRLGIEFNISHTLGDHANIYTTDAVCNRHYVTEILFKVLLKIHNFIQFYTRVHPKF